MPKSRVLLNFARFDWKELNYFALYISSVFYGGLVFLDPSVTKIILDAAIADMLSKGLPTLKRCSTLQITQRDQATDNLKDLLRNLADYIDMIAKGNTALILSTGFDAYTPEYKNTDVVFNVIQGVVSGQVISEWPPVTNNHGYVFRYSINEVTLRDVFTQVNAGTTGCTVDGLTRLKEYMFQIATVFSDHQSPWGDPVFLTVI